MLVRTASVALLIASGIPLPVRAQDPAGDVARQTVPLDFFAVMLGREPGDVQLGGRLADLPAGIPLEGIQRVVGRVRTLGDGTVVVAEAAGSPGAALDAYRKTLEAAGWRPPPQPEEPIGGGFRSRRASAVPPVWCAGDQSLTARAVGFADHSYLRVEVRPASRTACDVTLRLRRDRQGPSQLPALHVPDGVMVIGGGTSSSDDRLSTTTELETGIGVSALLDHFDAQLAGARWVAAGRSDAEEIGLRRYTWEDADGGRWSGALAAWRVREGLVHATFLMERPVPEAGG